MVFHTFYVSCYCFACMGAGLLIFRLIGFHGHDGSVSVLPWLASAFLLGQAALANIWLLSALNGLFSLSYILTVTAVLFLSGLVFLPRYYPALQRQITDHKQQISLSSWSFRLLVILTLLTMAGHGYAAGILHPSIDAESFYLLYPKVISSSERLAALHIWPGASHIGLLTEFHFAALMSMGGIGAAKLFMWPVSISLAIILFSLTGHGGLSMTGKWISLVILFTSTAFIFVISDGKTDIMGAALALCALYWLVVDEPLSPAVLILSGLLIGSAVMAKNTYLLCLVPPAMILVMWRLLSEGEHQGAFARGKTFLGGMTIIGLSLALAVLPNMIKNFALFHEPLAPFYYLSGERKTYLDQVWQRADVTRRILLTYPFSLSFGVYNGQYGNLSPLVVSFLPLIALVKRPWKQPNTILLRTTMVGLSGIALWDIFFPSFHAPRYFLVDLILLIPVAAWIADRVLVCQTTFLIRRAVMLCLVFSLSLILFSQGRLIAKGEVAGLDWGAAVMPVKGLHDDVIEKANAIIPEGSRVFLYGGNTVYLRGDILQGLSTMDEAGDYARLLTSRDRWEYLFNQGFSYVMVRGNPYVADPTITKLFNVSDRPGWLDVRQTLSMDGVVLYHLTSADRSRRPEFMLKQSGPHAWILARTQQI